MKTLEELMLKLCSITCDMSNLAWDKQRSSMDMDGRRKSNLSEQWVMLSRLYECIDYYQTI